jgi:hypothetical protein
MKRHALLPSLTLALLLAASPAWADGDQAGQPAAPSDVLTLKDGRRLEGEIVGEDDRFVSLRSGGVTRSYAKDSVASVERAIRPPAGGAPAAGSAETPPSPAEPPGKQKKKDRPDRKDAPLSDAAKSWLEALLARSGDADETVRRSVGAAIGAMGPQAIPAVRAAESAAADGAQKQFLGRLATDMEARRDKRGRAPGMPPEGMAPDGAMPGQEPGAPPAGRAGGPRRPLEDMMQRLTADLELREEQKPKVEAILKDALQKRFEIFRDARRDGLGPDEVAAKVEPLRTALLSEMKPALDEPQYAMFEEAAKRIFESQRGPTPPKPQEPAAPPKPPQPDQPK